MKTVIMAGGKGTRISSLYSDIPKPMIQIGGIPVIEHQIICLRDQGFTEFIITTSHLSEKITEYLGNGEKFGVRIEYFVEKEPLGNAGALFEIKEMLTEDFLLINGDIMFNIDIRRFLDYHYSHKGKITLLTHPNSHPYDSGIIISDDNGYVLQMLSKEDDKPKWYKNRANAGVHIISPEVLNNRPEGTKIDLDRDIISPLQGTGKIVCYDSPEYVKDMGTPSRYETVCNDYQSGQIEARSLIKKQKAIFLDRDGTINRYVGFLSVLDEFELLPKVPEAIRLANDAGYLVIVVTNQPTIARGELSFGELQTIHNKMETLLGNEGAYINALYFCPHHPDKGFEGEIKELKIECDCRKPKPGMLLRAKEDYNISMEDSWMIGDRESDVLAGKVAGCNTIQLGENISLYDAIYGIVNEEKHEHKC